MGKRDFPPSSQQPGDESAPRRIEVADGEESPKSETERILEEGVYEGDVFRTEHDGMGAIEYRIISVSTDDRGDVVYEVEWAGKTDRGGQAKETRTLSFSNLYDTFMKHDARLSAAGEDRYLDRYKAASLDEALDHANNARDDAPDGTEAARALDADILELELRATRGPELTAEQSSVSGSERLEEVKEVAPVSAPPEESSTSPNSEPEETRPQPPLSARDRIAEINQELGAMFDRNSKEAQALKRERDNLKQVVDQDNAERQARKTNGENLADDTSGSGESWRDETARLRSEYGAMTFKDTPEARQKLARIKELTEFIKQDNENRRNERQGGSEDSEQAKSAVDHLTDKIPGFTDKSPERQQDMRDMLEAFIAAGIIKEEFLNPPEQNGVETEEEKAERERREAEEREQKEEERREREAALQQQKDQLRQEVETESADEFQEALDDYAKAQASYEMGGRLGRKKREQRAHEAFVWLNRLKTAQSIATIEKWKEAGIYNPYEGEDPLDDEALNQRYSDDMFDEMRRLDKQKREAVNEVIQVRNEKWYRRAGAAVGRWLDKSRAAQFAVGFVGGAATGFGLIASGVPWPIKAVGTALVGAGMTAGTYALTRAAYTQDMQKRYQNDSGEAIDTLDLTAEQRAEMARLGQDSSLEQIGEVYGAALQEASRSQADAFNKEIDSRGDKNAGRVGLGFAAGALTGAVGGSVLNGMEGAQVGASSGDVPPEATNIDPIEESRLNPGNADSYGLGGEAGNADISAGASYDTNTNLAPEFAHKDLMTQYGVGDRFSEQQFREMYNALGGDNIFQTADGSPVEMRDMKGDIGIGYEAWDKDVSVDYTPEAKAWLGIS